MINPNTDILIQLLLDIRSIYNKYKINFWLDCGTLLGAVRTGTFIEWEDDIDLGSWESEYRGNIKSDLSTELEGRGYTVVIFNSFMNISGGSVKADIKFYKSHGQTAVERKYMPANPISKLFHVVSVLLIENKAANWNIYTVKNYFINFVKIFVKLVPKIFSLKLSVTLRNIAIQLGSRDISEVVPIKYFMSYRTFVFYGETYSIPNNYGEYLIYRYGRDWMTPNKNWVTEVDDGTVIHRGN